MIYNQGEIEYLLIMNEELTVNIMENKCIYIDNYDITVFFNVILSLMSGKQVSLLYLISSKKQYYN